MPVSEGLQSFFGVLFVYAFMGIFTGLAAKQAAEERGYYDGFRWGFFLSIVGVFYVIARGRRNGTWTSPYALKTGEKAAPAAPVEPVKMTQQNAAEAAAPIERSVDPMPSEHAQNRLNRLQSMSASQKKQMTEKDLDFSAMDTAEIKTMNRLFCGCENVVSMDLSSFNTSKVEWMREMFSGCKSLRELDLAHFDFSHVTDMLDMFSGCDSLCEVIVSDTILHALSNVQRPTGRMIEKMVARSEEEMEPVYAYGAQSRSQVYAYSDPYKYVKEPEMERTPFGEITEQQQRACLGLGEGVKLTIVPHRR